jgi:uncharacterized membrane protein
MIGRSHSVKYLYVAALIGLLIAVLPSAVTL